jgi:hypothetical protein
VAGTCPQLCPDNQFQKPWWCDLPSSICLLDGFKTDRWFCLFQLSTIRGSVLEEVIPSSSRLSSNRGLPVKDILDFTAPEINLSCLRLATSGAKTCEELMKLDEQGVSKIFWSVWDGFHTFTLKFQ